MELKVIRHTYNTGKHRNIIGDLYIDGEFFCHTLEDEIRGDGVKVYGETAIPAGEYNVKITYSPHFKRKLPLIYNNKDLCVHGKNGIKWCGVRMHGGNTEKDTLGCILVAFKTDGKRIWQTAEKALVQKLLQAKDDIKLIIENKPFTYE
jgi:hypothetical protein